MDKGEDGEKVPLGGNGSVQHGVFLECFAGAGSPVRWR